MRSETERCTRDPLSDMTASGPKTVRIPTSDRHALARRKLREWFSHLPGRLVLEAETRLLGELLPDLYGYYLLQVGRLFPAELLGHTRVLSPLVIDLERDSLTGPYPCIDAAADALPVASDSIDAVLLPHVLEFEDDPHGALREAQRVLVPEGHLLIFGFNPWSMMGASRLLLRRRGVLPWSGQFLALNRVRDWLALLGFDVLDVHTYFFRPPFASERLMKRLHALEFIGARACPYFAGSYLLVARKKVIPLTPIRPRWARRPRLVGVGLAKPTARVANGE